MNVKYQKSRDSVTIFLEGELDEYSAGATRAALDDLILDNINAKNFIFDMSEITFMDSTGIGLLIGRYKKIKQFGRQAYIQNATIAAEKVIQLAGLYKIMPKF